MLHVTNNDLQRLIMPCFKCVIEICAAFLYAIPTQHYGDYFILIQKTIISHCFNISHHYCDKLLVTFIDWFSGDRLFCHRGSSSQYRQFSLQSPITQQFLLLRFYMGWPAEQFYYWNCPLWSNPPQKSMHSAKSTSVSFLRSLKTEAPISSKHTK